MYFIINLSKSKYVEKNEKNKQKNFFKYSYNFNKENFSINEDVELTLDIKNINTLYVKIYEINTENYYYTNKKALDKDITVEGLVPTYDCVYSFDEKPQILSRKKLILEKIKTGKFTFPPEEWDTISPLAKDLVSKMLTFHPSKRLSASECLEHKWLVANNNKTVDKKISIRCLNNMKKFHANRKLQQASLTYIVNNLLSKEEKNDLLELFQQFDTNGDGVLSKEEILNGYKTLMPFEDAEKEVERIMNEVDIDKSGTIDYNEFVLATINKQKLLNKEKLEATFKMFDKDGSGTITADEIKSVLGKTVDKNILEEMIKEVDTNGDQEISLVEFKEMMLKFLE